MSTEDFAELYERHVGKVVSGDIGAALADIAEENLATAFDGVVVPRAAVDAFEIKNVRVEGGAGIGETVYQTADGPIGLRSIWETRDGRWKAVALENFPVAGTLS
ncbi:hypothetical protein [Nocardia bovistercoris]|uniref:DUF4440 domain-containing protein n=1 Tax=Nocardia bovistercoris TaxID=2785916 RepID=A0A931IG11_9NOCA|nr:hypothetical protein [Nocardia bovistercoris]MBH0781047.1 hypothetical protein [Nocardia bovistercoris]